MTTNHNATQALETRVAHLEDELRRIGQRLDETVRQTGQHSQLLTELSTKLDAMRSDLQEIKKIPASFMPRVEVEARLRFNEERIEELQEAMKTITTQLADTRVATQQDLHRNTMATYGTLITVLLGGASLLITLMQIIPKK